MVKTEAEGNEGFGSKHCKKSCSMWTIILVLNILILHNIYSTNERRQYFVFKIKKTN